MGQTDARRRRLLGKLEGLRADAMLVTCPANVRYLSGFAGEGCLLVTADKTTLFTDFRYEEDAVRSAPGCQMACPPAAQLDSACMAEARAAGAWVVAIEAGEMTVSAYRALEQAAGEQGVALVETEQVVEALRLIKDADEIAAIKRACALTDEAFSDILKCLKPGVSERDIAAELLYRLRLLGADGPSFDFIVASGTNGSKPHAVPTSRRLCAGELVTLDFGCRVDGYCSDMTRTVAIGQPSPELARIYRAVYEAQRLGREAYRAGLPCARADAVAREYLASQGYGQAFGHSLGHGVGLDIHERPRVSAASTAVLEAGMVVSCEPGVYLPGTGGVRIEDLCLIESGGCSVLSQSPRELLER
nr:aminopeptidase P family protein [bacterium]